MIEMLKNKNQTSYRTVEIEGYSVFYREAGNPQAPAVLFLHGFPSSSKMYQAFFNSPLAENYHLIAPDYIGFGHSSKPDTNQFDYTFDNLARYISRFIEHLALDNFTLFMQDYGGPIGFHLAEIYGSRISAMIIQNAVCHEQGLSQLWEKRRAFWANKEKYTDAVRENFISLDATKLRHVGSTPCPEKIDPDTWMDEFYFLNQPNQSSIQLELFYDYQNNVKSYLKWQQWMKSNQLPLLVMWGKYDLSFTIDGAWAYLNDNPQAEIHLLNAGHFAMDEASSEIIFLTNSFLHRLIH